MARKDNPDYDIRMPEWNQADPWFRFSEAKRKGTLLGGRTPWRVATDDKRVPVHGRASTCDSLLSVYPDAIKVGAPAGTSEMSFMLPFFACVGVVAFGLAIAMDFTAISNLMVGGEVEWAVFFS